MHCPGSWLPAQTTNDKPRTHVVTKMIMQGSSDLFRMVIYLDGNLPWVLSPAGSEYSATQPASYIHGMYLSGLVCTLYNSPQLLFFVTRLLGPVSLTSPSLTSDSLRSSTLPRLSSVLGHYLDFPSLTDYAYFGTRLCLRHLL